MVEDLNGLTACVLFRVRTKSDLTIVKRKLARQRTRRIVAKSGPSVDQKPFANPWSIIKQFYLYLCIGVQ